MFLDRGFKPSLKTSLSTVNCQLSTVNVPEGCYRTQAIASSPSPPIAEFSIKKDDRTMVSYQRH
ncbi:hypothetical protein QUB52_29050 [Microcoleus sp. A6-C6]